MKLYVIAYIMLMFLGYPEHIKYPTHNFLSLSLVDGDF